MLKLKYMFENYELARFALENWKYDEESLTEYLKYFRISSNAVYPFESGGKRCFLRLAPAEEKLEQNLKGELEFLQYLQKTGYPAMIPVVSKTGNILLELDTAWGKYYASVFEGVPGVPIEDTDYNAKIMLSYGETLGRLHKLSMEYEPDCPKWSYIEALEWIKEVLTEHRVAEGVLEEADAVERELGSLVKNRETYGLVHYDFEPDNVFYNNEDESSYVIDFEDGMYHFFLVDIEQVFDSLSEELEGETLRKAKECFLKGYQSEKKLESDYEERLPLMRRFCNLYSYARLIRCMADEVSEAPEWMCNLRKILEHKVEQLESAIMQV